MSLSSSSLTRFELFFLVFFLGSGARFLVFPPRVERMREFSSICSLRANAASSSSAGLIFLAFFLGGGAESSSSESADSESGERLWLDASEVSVFAPFSTEGMGSCGSVLPALSLHLSKRCRMSSVMCSWSSVNACHVTPNQAQPTFWGEMSSLTRSCRPLRMLFAETLLRSLPRRISSMMAVYEASTSGAKRSARS
jgi:hypothetical protein